ncbi:MAG TPA: hypothetical protein VEL11_18850 [Candidatus Bathyarchaeia archaeon]|nr:hypothetical protein [Candidatus Bathyarchaeia archaeon]
MTRLIGSNSREANSMADLSKSSPYGDKLLRYGGIMRYFRLIQLNGSNE